LLKRIIEKKWSILNFQTIRTTWKGEIIYEVLTVFKTSLPQTDPAKIRHTSRGTDRWRYRNDSEIQGVLGVNTTDGCVHLSPITTAKANLTTFNSTRYHWPSVNFFSIYFTESQGAEEYPT
jgi:hypothetical protein